MKSNSRIVEYVIRFAIVIMVMAFVIVVYNAYFGVTLK